MTNTRYDVSEQEQLIVIFSKMLRQPTEDGGRKRAAGLKVSWKDDDTHEGAMYRHLARWAKGDTIDEDSGAHALVHVAWRALALAWQEMNPLPEESYTEYEVIK